ncbi:MAG: hypothetical protein IPJ39_17160 [Saprospiraceae bacterium]|nr:hypothetical protein [Saprospiraceae bacterium]
MITVSLQWQHILMVKLSPLSDGANFKNSSQWRGQVHVNGRNFPSFGRSDFATGHRVLGTFTLRLSMVERTLYQSTFSLMLEGQK